MEAHEFEHIQSFGLFTMIKDIDGCIQTLGGTDKCKTRADYEAFVKNVRCQIIDVIKKIKTKCRCKGAPQSKEDLQRTILQIEMENDAEKMKIDHLRSEWFKQQHTLAQLQDTFNKKCKALMLHDDYFSLQGSAICSIIEVLFKDARVVDSSLIDEEKELSGLMKIADKFLLTFTKTYVYEAALEDSSDRKFVAALYGTIVHVSGSPRGCEFLVTREECRNMLRTVVRNLSHVKRDTALKTILWTVVRNIIKTEAGLTFMQSCPDLLSSLVDCICEEYDPELYDCALDVLYQLSRNVPDKKYSDTLNDSISENRLKELSSSTVYKKVNHWLPKILRNLERAAKSFVDVEDELSPAISCWHKCSSTSLRSWSSNNKQSVKEPSVCASTRTIRIDASSIVIHKLKIKSRYKRKRSRRLTKRRRKCKKLRGKRIRRVLTKTIRSPTGSRTMPIFKDSFKCVPNEATNSTTSNLTYSLSGNSCPVDDDLFDVTSSFTTLEEEVMPGELSCME